MLIDNENDCQFHLKLKLQALGLSLSSWPTPLRVKLGLMVKAAS